MKDVFTWLKRQFSATMIVLVGLMALAGFLRFDAVQTEDGRLQYAYIYAWEGTAISLMKGLGFKIYPVPDYRSSGKRIDPIDYLTPEWQSKVDESSLPNYTFGAGVPIISYLLYEFFEPRHIYYIAFQQIVTLFGVLLIFYAGRTFFDSRLVGLMSAAFYSVCLLTIKHGLFLGREAYTLMAMLIALAGAAWVMNHWRHSPRSAFWGAAATGFAIGLCALFRSTSLPFLVAVLFMLPLLMPFRKGLSLGFVCLIAGLLTISPWVIRNKIVLDSYTLSQESTFLALFGGIGFNPNPIGMNATDSVSFEMVSRDFALAPGTVGNTAYYGGGAGAYEAISAKRFKEYVTTFPNTFFRATLRNLWDNATNFGEVAYYDPVWALTPDLKWTREFFGTPPRKIRKLWMKFTQILPYMAFAGAALALLLRPMALILLIPFAMTLGQLSIAAAHVTRYTFHIIDIYYIFASFLIVLPIDYWLRRRKASRTSLTPRRS